MFSLASRQFLTSRLLSLRSYPVLRGLSVLRNLSALRGNPDGRRMTDYWRAHGGREHGVGGESRMVGRRAHGGSLAAVSARSWRKPGWSAHDGLLAAVSVGRVGWRAWAARWRVLALDRRRAHGGSPAAVSAESRRKPEWSDGGRMGGLPAAMSAGSRRTDLQRSIYLRRRTLFG
jgi:hypothetical protein